MLISSMRVPPANAAARDSGFAKSPKRVTAPSCAYCASASGVRLTRIRFFAGNRSAQQILHGLAPELPEAPEMMMRSLAAAMTALAAPLNSTPAAVISNTSRRVSWFM